MKKRMMAVLSFSLLFVLSICLCGCNIQKESTSGNNITEERSSTQEKEKDKAQETSKDKNGSGEKTDADTPHPFANENFIYMKKGKGIQQISKETGDIRLFANKIETWEELRYVTEDAIYYTSSKIKGCKLCRVPIVKSSSKLSGEVEELDFANKEEILTERGSIWDVYVTEDYILYHFRDDFETLESGAEETAIKYDKKSGEKKYFDLESVTYDISYAKGNRLIFGCDNFGDGYYCLDLEKDEMTHFATDYYDTTTKDMNGSAGSDNAFYYCVNDKEVMVYDMSAGKESSYVKWKEIEKICKNVVAEVGKGWKFDNYYLCDMFYYDDTLYLQVQLDWKRGKYFYMNYIMLSINTKEKDGKLGYDREMTGLMQRDVYEDDDTEAVKWSQYAQGWENEWNFGRFLTIVDDTAVLILDDYPAQVATYDMKTGELQKVSKNDAGYYLPYSDSDEPYGNDNYELENSMRYMPDEYED